MNGIVLTFDRLPVSFLGCYGHSNATTPNFDRLAASSVVFDQHFAEQVDAPTARHVWQTGRSHFQPDVREPPVVGKMLSQAGVETTLIRERNTRTPLPAFQQTFDVTGRHGLDAEADGTPFFRLIERGESLLAGGFLAGETRRLLWLHSHGPPSDWRPPRAFARASLARHFADVDDRDTDDDAAEGAPIEQRHDAAFDEFVSSLLAAATGESDADELTFDEWQMARAIFSGGVELLDQALVRLLAALDAHSSAEPTLLIVTASAGMAVGERSMLALPATALPEELVHAPLIVRRPDTELGTRRQQLVQTVDLVPTLLDWFGVAPTDQKMDGRSLLPAIDNSAASERDFICLTGAAGAAAIRTPDRYLVVEASDETGVSPPPRLFVKPDDVWEVNEVASQSPDEVAELSETLQEFIRGAKR